MAANRTNTSSKCPVQNGPYVRKEGSIQRHWLKCPCPCYIMTFLHLKLCQSFLLSSFFFRPGMLECHAQLAFKRHLTQKKETLFFWQSTLTCTDDINIFPASILPNATESTCTYPLHKWHGMAYCPWASESIIEQCTLSFSVDNNYSPGKSRDLWTVFLWSSLHRGAWKL